MSIGRRAADLIYLLFAPILKGHIGLIEKELSEMDENNP
jgi:hypothetical protein